MSEFRIGDEAADGAAAIGRNLDGDSRRPAPGGVVEEVVQQQRAVVEWCVSHRWTVCRQGGEESESGIRMARTSRIVIGYWVSVSFPISLSAAPDYERVWNPLRLCKARAEILQDFRSFV